LIHLFLASTSPARAQILLDIGLSATIIAPHVDEDAVVASMTHEKTAASIALHLARLKAESILGPQIDGLVLGGDSVFEFGGEFLGKPHLPEVATRRWKDMRGRTGVLHSGLWVVDNTGGVMRGGQGHVSHAEVSFSSDISDSEIDAYVATKEPLTVAGAFTLDAKGAAFIEEVRGDPWAVVGMSASALRMLVLSLGHDYTSLWALPED
jgi:septum formation protein